MSITVSVVGTIATEPKLITASTGTLFCTFRLACTERWFNRDKSEWVDGNTNWFTVTAFRTLAEHGLRSFHKGQRLIVHGKLRVRNWDNGEKSGTNVEIEAESYGHDLLWGTSTFSRDTTHQATPAQDPAAAEAPAETGTDGDGQHPATVPQSDGWLPAAEEAAA